MSAFVKIGAAAVVLAVGAGLVWFLPGETRTETPVLGPRPPSSAARGSKPREAFVLERPQTPAQLEAAARAADPVPGPASGARPKKKKKPEPGLGDPEAYEPAPPIPPRPAEAGRVAGTVVDENGRPVQCRTWLVGELGGSYGGNTAADGGFDMDRQGLGTFQIKAWTEDARVGVFTAAGVRPEDGVSDVLIPLEKGGSVKLLFGGGTELDACRCALFTNGIRHSDFTLRKDQAQTVVVPVGSLIVQLYTGGGDDQTQLADRTLYIAPGQVEEAAFTLD